jgi:hypothetical protein
MRPDSIFNIHWRRLSRWLLLGTFVMLIWLLYPTIRCSISGLQKTSFGEIAETKEEDEGFFSKWIGATKRCYKITPLLGQEEWKTYTFLGLAGATVLTSLIGRFANRKLGI